MFVKLTQGAHMISIDGPTPDLAQKDHHRVRLETAYQVKILTASCV